MIVLFCCGVTLRAIRDARSGEVNGSKWQAEEIKRRLANQTRAVGLCIFRIHGWTAFNLDHPCQ